MFTIYISPFSVSSLWIALAFSSTCYILAFLYLVFIDFCFPYITVHSADSLQMLIPGFLVSPSWVRTFTYLDSLSFLSFFLCLIPSLSLSLCVCVCVFHSPFLSLN